MPPQKPKSLEDVLAILERDLNGIREEAGLGFQSDLRRL